jgi:hypothetical protein
MFLLGSFTSGLFSGASDVMKLANDWEDLKTKRLMGEGASQVSEALKTDQKSGSAGFGSKPTTANPYRYQEPDLSTVPAPKFMEPVTKEALPALDTSKPKTTANSTGPVSDYGNPAQEKKGYGDATATATYPDSGEWGALGRAFTRKPPPTSDSNQVPLTYTPDSRPRQALTPRSDGTAATLGPGQGQALATGGPNLSETSSKGFGQRILDALGSGGAATGGSSY